MNACAGACLGFVCHSLPVEVPVSVISFLKTYESPKTLYHFSCVHLHFCLVFMVFICCLPYFSIRLWTGRKLTWWFQELKVPCMWVQVGLHPCSVREHLAEPSACGFCLQHTESRAPAAFPSRASSVCICSGRSHRTEPKGAIHHLQ